MSDRNNLDRMAIPAQDQIPNNAGPQIPTPHLQQPSGLQFSVPTEFVDLPSKGKYYPDGHPLKNKTSIEVKFMTAKEEDILASTTLIRKGIVFDRLLQSIIVDPIDPNDLLIGDKNAILISSRINGYGTDYQTEIKCPSCGSSSKFSFDLSDSKASITTDHDFKKEMGVTETESGTFIINVENLGRSIEVKPLNGHDEKRLSYMLDAKAKNNFVESLVTDTLKTYIVSVDGDSSPNTINSFVDTLPARESRRIRTIYKHAVPRIEVTSPYSCASCGYQQELEVPLNTDFFWPND